MPFLARLPASIQIKLSPRLCSWLSMLLLPAFPIATTQMNAPTPTEMPRIVRTLLTQLRLSAALASRIVFLRLMLSDVGNPDQHTPDEAFCSAPIPAARLRPEVCDT